MSRTKRRKTLFLLNGKRRDLRELISPLQAYLPGSKVFVTHESQSAEHIIRKNPNFDIYIAGGGDGTLNSVLNGILNNDLQDKIIGVLPLGTENDFATVMGYDPKALCSLTSTRRKKDCFAEIQKTQQPLIATQKGEDEFVREIDVGQFQADDVEPTYFFSSAGVGLYGDVVKELNGLETSTKRYLGRTVRSYFCRKKMNQRYSINYNYGALEGPYDSIEFMNSPLFGKGLSYSPKSSVKDGKLEMIVLRNVGLGDVIPLILQVKAGRGKHLNRAKNIIYKDDITNAWLRSEQPFVIHYDGETYPEATTNLEVIVHPKKIKFIQDFSKISLK